MPDVEPDTGSTSALTAGGSSSSGVDRTTDGRTDEGVAFVEEPDFGDGLIEGCDQLAQDCPAGLKCMPWGSDGGPWNGSRCSTIVDDPGAPKDPCTVKQSRYSGVDSCELGAMCWDVDPRTLQGTCLAMCSGDGSQPICEDPDTYCPITSEPEVFLCLPTCDPLPQSCTEGQTCIPVEETWICVANDSGDAGSYGDPCETMGDCNPGLICLSASATPGCPGSIGCCTEICDLDAPLCTGAPEGQQCQPWYEPGAAPPGLEDVGACALPL